MTGPEHYAEAERLMALSQGATFKDEETIYARQAQAHATLALVAITAVAGDVVPGGSWHKVLL